MSIDLRQPGSGDGEHQFPPGLPLRQALGGPPGDGGDGGDSGVDAGETPLGTDEDPPPPRRRKPNGDPDSSGDGGGKDFRGHKHVSMSINEWGKPIPKLELSPRVYLQKASKITHIWELWSMNVALTMSTWNGRGCDFLASGIPPV